MRIRRPVAWVLLLAVLSLGAYTGTPWRWGRTAAVVGDLPTCNSSREGVLAYVTAASAFYKCTSSAWSVAFTATPGVVDNITISGNTIASTNTDGAINLDPNGTGAVVIPAPVTGLTSLAVDTISLNGNTISTTDPAGVLTIDSQDNGGSFLSHNNGQSYVGVAGNVVIVSSADITLEAPDGLYLPIRATPPPVTAAVIYYDTSGAFCGYDAIAAAWVNLGGGGTCQ